MKNRVLEVELGEKEVQVNKLEQKEQKPAQDQYDTDDSFLDEEEELEALASECEYDNFVCIAKGTTWGSKRKEEPQLQKIKKIKKISKVSKLENSGREMPRIRKVKKENMRLAFFEKKEEKMKSLPNITADAAEQAFHEILVLEILTSDRVSIETLSLKLREIVKNEEARERIRAYAETRAHNSIIEMYEEKNREQAQLKEKIEEEIEKEKKRIDEQFPDDYSESKYCSIVLEDELLETMLKYAENAYLVFFTDVYLTGKVRPKEYKPKYQIFEDLSAMFPESYGNTHSVGKKVAGYRHKILNLEKKSLEGENKPYPGEKDGKHSSSRDEMQPSSFSSLENHSE